MYPGSVRPTRRGWFRKATGSISVSGLLFLLAFALGLSACGSGAGDPGSGDVTVFAAASLTEAFTDLGEIYEEENEGSDARFSFGASSELAGQISAGAPADVFASADEPNMAKVVAAGSNSGDPVNFAANRLVIAVPTGNPGRVNGLADLADRGLKVAVCAPEVPCGNAARKLFDIVGVKARVDTEEPDVKAVLTKVELGEVDAGLVYRSDALAAGDRVEAIGIPRSARALNTYPIVPTRDGDNPDAGRSFIDLVLSDRGQKTLQKWGFRSP